MPPPLLQEFLPLVVALAGVVAVAAADVVAVDVAAINITNTILSIMK